MAISHSLLPEFEMEMANTRKTLERVPDEKFEFKPHPKSGSSCAPRRISGCCAVRPGGPRGGR